MNGCSARPVNHQEDRCWRLLDTTPRGRGLGTLDRMTPKEGTMTALRLVLVPFGVKPGPGGKLIDLDPVYPLSRKARPRAAMRPS